MSTRELDYRLPTAESPTDGLVLLAARGLRRCERCGRILVSRKVMPADGGTWRCRDRADCARAQTASPAAGAPSAGAAVDFEREDLTPSAAAPTEVVAEPGHVPGRYYCGNCWRRFPEAQLVPVREEIGRAFRCGNCRPPLGLTEVDPVGASFPLLVASTRSGRS